MGKQKTFYIETLGCKVNQYESDGIAAELTAQGMKRMKSKQGVDVCIVNTCAVTSKAGMQSRQAIRKLIRENPHSKVIVTGCHAQTDPGQIKEIPKIDLIVCHRDKGKIADCITRDKSCRPEFEFRPPDHSGANEFLTFDRPVSGSMTRAYLKIQDGCNAFCTYCIVPYARGGSVSMPEKEVYTHIEGLRDKGFKEIILTGIHTGMYGLDLSPSTSLTRLVRELDKKKAEAPETVVERIRISSIEPNEITEGLINAAKEGHILCDHFHIPLQAGDNDVLKKMKRPYTAEAFAAVVEQIHTTLPFAGIGLDILIGFPGETDQQFENTYKLVENLPVSYLHVFPFSARKGTPAFHFEPKVGGEIIKERCAAMRDLGRKKQEDFIRANMGRPLEGLVQHRADKETGLFKAVTSNYLTLEIQGDEGLKGKLVDLTIDSCDKELRLSGRILN